VKEPIYLDTSALAKWYLNEARSDDFAAFVVAEPRPIVSRLTAVEIRSLLERRRRTHQITTAIVRKVVAAFERDVRDGHLEMHALEDAHAILASELLHRLAPHPLRTLDALHLAVAISLELGRIATADRVLAAAAASLGLEVERFD
jgi:predicted nucleic acid-binding protein